MEGATIEVMEKGLVVVLGALAGAGLVFACSGSDNNSNFADTPLLPEAGDAPTGFNTDGAGEGGGEGGTPNCTAAIPGGFTPNWIAPNTSLKGSCKAADIDAYYTQCLSDGTQIGTPTWTAQCDKWVASNTACASCLEPSNHSGPVQWYEVLGVKRRYVTFNIAGCIAIEQNALGANDCGGAYNTAVECKRQACEQCFATGGTAAQFLSCEQSAGGQGVCKSYGAVESSTCSDAGPEPAQCKVAAGQTDADFFKQLMTVFCGN
jgi:hypothetical protein